MRWSEDDRQKAVEIVSRFAMNKGLRPPMASLEGLEVDRGKTLLAEFGHRGHDVHIDARTRARIALGLIDEDDGSALYCYIVDVANSVETEHARMLREELEEELKVAFGIGRIRMIYRGKMGSRAAAP